MYVHNKYVNAKLSFVVFSLIFTLLFNQLFSFDDEATAKKTTTTMDILKHKCVQCHGGIKDGKKKVKGKTDLAELLKSGIHVSDSETWAKVIESIESGEMPPSESEVEIKSTEKSAVVNQLNSILNTKSVEERMLTPDEIGISINQIFGVNTGSYDSFKRLAFNQNPLVHYPTIDSERLMSVNYINDMDYSISSVLKNFVLQHPYNSKKMADEKFTVIIWPENQTGSSSAVFIDRDFSKRPPGRPKTVSATVSPEVLKKYREELSAWRVKFRAYRDTLLHLKSFDLRRKQSLVMETTYDRRFSNKDFPVGRYRITFKAVALNRDRVREVYEKYPKDITDKYKKIGWESLIDEKCRLDISLRGTSRNNFRSLGNNAKRGHVIKSIEIDDNVEKTYSFEFELRTPNSIHFDFANGPRSRNHITLKLPGDSRARPNGKCYNDNEGREYAKPTIRFNDVIKLERISYLKRNDYEVADNSKNSKFSQNIARQNVLQYIEELGLSDKSENLIKYFDDLPKSLKTVDRYLQALKQISMSPENILISLSGNLDEDARFVSYSLLKKHPTKIFRSNYKAYRSGEITPSKFSEYIVSNPDFENFINIFVSKWMGYGVKLDDTKYSNYLRELPFNKETELYLLHMFKNNLPALELFNSGYKIVNHGLSKYYKLEEKGLKHYEFKMVKSSSHKNGIINQGSFFVANSSGVDPLPFRRADWISENVFDVKLPPPPNDVNIEEFAQTKAAKTFKERTVIHAKNKQCQGCHSKIDPIAFAMHNFDTVGDRISLQDKEAEEALRKRILSAKKTIASAFTRHLISYVIGRNTTVFDNSVVNKILEKTEKEEYALRSILANIIDNYFKGDV